MEPIRIFISYAREDSSIAEKLFDTLALHPELDPWFDRNRLQPGDDWKRVVLKNLDESDFVLVLLSSHSIGKTGFVQREVREAIERALLRPPNKRYLIPVRLDDCSPVFDELSQLQYLDLFPDWSVGVNSLCEFFGVKHYTHYYVAMGFYKGGVTHPKLVPLGDQITGEYEAVKLVNLEGLPKLDAKLVPDGRMGRQGPQLHRFLKLWTVASTAFPDSLYRKSDWREIDDILFVGSRTDERKRNLIEMVRRQWALAKELAHYDEDDWIAFIRLIQGP